MGIATALIGSAVVGLVGAKKSSDAIKDSAKTNAKVQEDIADESIALQREMAEQQRADFAPWREAGEKSLNSIMAGIESGAFEVGKIDLQADPGYQVRMQEGIDAIDASASARGRILSGAQEKRLTRYGQEQGSKEYANAYAREANEKATKYNILSGMSQAGQASAAGQAQASSQLASTSANIMANNAQYQSASNQAIGNARAGAYQDQAQVVNQAAQNWLSYKMNNPATPTATTGGLK